MPWPKEGAAARRRGEMLFQMIGAVAQFERSLIAERVKSGLANTRANGKILGRPPLRKLTRKEVADLRRQRVHEKLPFRALAERISARQPPPTALDY
jgi:DNA invertase Pin-like site-specific DNA recombinase